MSSICSGELRCSPSSSYHILRYIYVYVEYTRTSLVDDQPPPPPETIDCFEPKTVSLERTGKIKIVTVSALISHFLPYFNSSINPIIYNIMSGELAELNGRFTDRSLFQIDSD